MRRAAKKITVFLICGALLIYNIKNIQASAPETMNTSLITHPAPFNISGTHSTDITPFYRWTGVLARMDASPQSPRPWLNNKKALEGLPAEDMVQKVNDIINSYDYIADPVNWKTSDYWETPTEFFLHGGDCEDFAIAKYAWLRFLGIAENRLLIAIVHDRIRDRPHAVLILYMNNKAMVLDSQVNEIRDSSTMSRYRPLYSINHLGWWLPITSRNLVIGMINGTHRQGKPAGNDVVMQFTQKCLAGASLPECINAIEPAAGQPSKPRNLYGRILNGRGTHYRERNEDGRVKDGQ